MFKPEKSMCIQGNSAFLLVITKLNMNQTLKNYLVRELSCLNHVRKRKTKTPMIPR